MYRLRAKRAASEERSEEKVRQKMLSKSTKKLEKKEGDGGAQRKFEQRSVEWMVVIKFP